MKPVTKVGASEHRGIIGLIAVIFLLAFAFREHVYKWMRTVDDPVQHDFVEAARNDDVQRLPDLFAKGAAKALEHCATESIGRVP